MSEVVRLTLVSHAMTDAMAAGRFPLDEELNPLGRRQLAGFDAGAADVVLSGPELRARQSAE
ncbi:phosphoglycerate mutase family protein, partial [Mycolicibacterium gadium]